MAVKLEIEGFRSLNEQLGEAEDRVRNLVNQFGVGSKEVQQAAQEAGKLKQQMMEADRAIESFTSAGRFDAVAGGIQGVVGGFAAVQGAMAVVGVESEALESTLLKVQGALALVEGVKGVTEFAKSFSTLKTVAVNAFNGIKAAIGSTGIGLLIIGLGIAVQQLVSYLNEASEAEEKNKKALQDLGKAAKDAESDYNDLNKSITNARDLMVAQAELAGASEAKLFDIRIKSINNLIQALEKQREKDYELYEQQFALTEQTTKKGKERNEALEKLNEEYQATVKKRNDEEKALIQELALADINYRKGVKERQKKANEDAKKANEDRKKNELDASKDLRESLRKFAEERENDDLKNAQLRLANDLERLKEARDEELKQENLTAKAKGDIQYRYFVEMATRIQQGNEEIAKITADRQKEELDRLKAHTDKLIAEDERRYAKSTDVVDTFFKYKQLDLENSLVSEEEYSKQSEQLELERLEKQLEMAEKYGEDTVDLELQIAQKKRAIRQREIDEEKEKQQIIEDFVFNSLNTIADLQEQYLNLEINNRKAALQNAYTEELNNKKLSDQEKADLDYELALEMEKLNEQSFQNEKQMNIVRATISGAQAVLNAFQAGSVFGPQTGAAFAAVAGIFTAAQIAMIASQNYVPSTIQKPGDVSGGGGSGSQYEMGGLLMGPSHDMGGVRTTLGELEGGEFVMNRRSTANFLPLLEQMNAMGNEGGPQLAQAQATPVIKTYVVASEMSSQQEANARIGRLARF